MESTIFLCKSDVLYKTEIGCYKALSMVGSKKGKDPFWTVVVVDNVTFHLQVTDCFDDSNPASYSHRNTSNSCTEAPLLMCYMLDMNYLYSGSFNIIRICKYLLYLIYIYLGIMAA